MRTTQGSISRYAFEQVPDSADALVAYLRREMPKIQAVMGQLADGHLDVTSVAPTKPRAGDIRYASAGVLGAGEGFWGYYAGAWHFLG